MSNQHFPSYSISSVAKLNGLHIVEDGSLDLPSSLNLYIAMSPGRGRGVFTRDFIPKRTLIDVSPVLIFKDQDRELSQQTLLAHYTYNWFESHQQALALGLGSMFNHAQRFNVGFMKDKHNAVIRYYTLRNIEANEELFIHYGPYVWFDESDSSFVDLDESYFSDDSDSSDDGNPIAGMKL